MHCWPAPLRLFTQRGACPKHGRTKCTQGDSQLNVDHMMTKCTQGDSKLNMDHMQMKKIVTLSGLARRSLPRSAETGLSEPSPLSCLKNSSCAEKAELAETRGSDSRSLEHSHTNSGELWFNVNQTPTAIPTIRASDWPNNELSTEKD